MSRQFFSEALAWSTQDGTAIASSTTETIAFPNVTIDANYMQDGRQLICEYWGKFSNTATPTIRMRLRWGGVAGTLLADSSTVTTASGVTSALWMVRLRITTRANGASGSLFALGEFVIYGAVAPTVGSATGAPAIAAMTSAGITAPAAVTCDLTAATALSITQTWSASSSSNTFTGHNLYIDAPN